MNGGPVRDFISQMLDNTDAGARARGRPNYTAQSERSCMALYGLCVMTDPDFVVDVGTAAGASCITLAYALRSLGKDPERQLVTICQRQGYWTDYGIPYNAQLARGHGIELARIPFIEADFRAVQPPEPVKDGATTFAFYDIHDWDDGSEPPSSHLLNVWIPAIKQGVVAVHDTYSKRHAQRHTAHAQHFGLGLVYGRREVVPIVEYLNSKNGQLVEVPGAWLTFFCVEDGEVL